MTDTTPTTYDQALASIRALSFTHLATRIGRYAVLRNGDGTYSVARQDGWALDNLTAEDAARLVTTQEEPRR